MRTALAIMSVVLVACGARDTRFPLRAPLAADQDLQATSVPCREYRAHDRTISSCAPEESYSPFMWDQVDNLVFAPLTRTLAVETETEAVNVNALDEVPDSAWFTNRAAVADAGAFARGACSPDDILPSSETVPDGGWLIDHGKDNGATLGFRVVVPGKGKYLLKADDQDQPERASAASVIGAGLYQALGFNTTCEQVVLVRREQFRLTDGLALTDNSGYVHPFDEKMLEHVLAQSARGPGGLIRMQASKWLPGVTIGPFSYTGVRRDDPNDVVKHQNRRELRGGRLLAAWIDHWDARSQNSMDVWFASDAVRERSSPGVVKHFILDTSESFGGRSGGNDLTDRLGVSYEVDLPDVFGDLVTFGALSRPWDRRTETRGREKFGFFTARDFRPERWKPMYPNPAFERMTERDAAWMARLIARPGPSELAALVDNGRFTDPSDAAYLTDVLVARQRAILARYLTRLSPLGDVRISYNDEVCATDFARLRAVVPVERFSYRAVERRGSRARELAIELRGAADVCIHLPHEPLGRVHDDDPRRYARYEISNGTGSGPLVIFAYDREGLPPVVVGVSRREPAH